MCVCVFVCVCVNTYHMSYKNHLVRIPTDLRTYATNALQDYESIHTDASTNARWHTDRLVAQRAIRLSGTASMHSPRPRFYSLSRPLSTCVYVYVSCMCVYDCMYVLHMYMHTNDNHFVLK